MPYEENKAFFCKFSEDGKQCKIKHFKDGKVKDIMKKIIIADATLRESVLRHENALSFKEKIEIAKFLDSLCVDVIELNPLTELKTDTLLTRTISSLVKNSALSCPAGMSEEEIDNAWNAVSGAAKPRLVISLPTSTVQMEYLCQKKPAKMLELIKSLTEYAASKCSFVEFEALDATRSERKFLADAVKTAVEAGAKAITLCDSTGEMLPSEFDGLYNGLYEDFPEIKDVEIYASCRNDLHMAVSDAVASIKAGACGVKVQASCGSLPQLAEFADVLKQKGDALGISANLNQMIIKRTVGQIKRIADTEKSGSTPFDTTVGNTDAGNTLLDITANITTVNMVITKLGYNLSDEDLCKVYEEFIRVARKKQVGAKELDAIVASTALQVPPTYKLSSYVINSGNIITSTAHIILEKGGVELSGISTGDGPIDAAFLAVEQIIGHHYELDDFQIIAVTEGKEAMGQALVKLRSGGRLFSGTGISTDIIGASIRAYINALNKIVYEENNI